MSRFATHLWPVGLLLLAGSACQPAAEITTYTAERTAPPRPVFEAAQVASQLDRIWAAMLPLDETAWFFKVSGPAERVTAHRAEFQEFLASLGKGPSAEKPLSWKLPVGWTEKGPSEMRLATLVIPDDEQDLELAVSSLPLGSEWEDFVAVNVNRWLGQLSQTDLPKSTILQQTTQADTPAGPVSVIELAGILKKLPGMNPHAGMAGGPAPVAATAAQPPAPSKAGFKFTAPESWQPGQTSSMRKAAFNIGSGDERAEVTVIALPSSAEAQITDVQANVVRWAGQVGLPPDTNVEEFIEETTIGGNQGSLARLEGPAEANPRLGMLAAMVEQGDQVWFFKMFGTAPLVDSELSSFRDFLASVRFE